MARLLDEPLDGERGKERSSLCSLHSVERGAARPGHIEDHPAFSSQHCSEVAGTGLQRRLRERLRTHGGRHPRSPLEQPGKMTLILIGKISVFFF